VVSFANTVIVMTSNAGSQFTENLMGFGKTDKEASKDRAMKALREFLRPEFIGRVDEVVFFAPLSKEDFEKIAHLMLKGLVTPLEEKGIALHWTDEAAAVLAQKAHGGKRGARDLRNVIRREVEDKIAELLVERFDMPPKSISIQAAGETEVSVSAEEKV
jgi:ATP-dependent Clp protease ATP-binding subunit ClpA